MGEQGSRKRYWSRGDRDLKKGNSPWEGIRKLRRIGSGLRPWLGGEWPKAVRGCVMSENGRNYFFWNEKAFQDAAKEVVCPQCCYMNEPECLNPDPRGCALFRYLPDLVRIAQRMNDPNMSDYIEAVSKEMKFDCEKPSSLGEVCNLLDSPHCGLDRLLPFVLEAVLKTDRLLEARQQSVLS